MKQVRNTPHCQDTHDQPVERHRRQFRPNQPDQSPALILSVGDVLARWQRLCEVLVDHAKKLFGGGRRVASGPEVPQNAI
jgi:hypothetical protein